MVCVGVGRGGVILCHPETSLRRMGVLAMVGRAGTIALSQAVAAAERQTDAIQTRFWICSRGSRARVGAGAVVHEVRQGPWEEV